MIPPTALLRNPRYQTLRLVALVEAQGIFRPGAAERQAYTQAAALCRAEAVHLLSSGQALVDDLQDGTCLIVGQTCPCGEQERLCAHQWAVSLERVRQAILQHALIRGLALTTMGGACCPQCGQETVQAEAGVLRCCMGAQVGTATWVCGWEETV